MLPSGPLTQVKPMIARIAMGKNDAPWLASTTMNAYASDATTMTAAALQISVGRLPTRWLSAATPIMAMIVATFATISIVDTSEAFWCSTPMSSPGRKESIICAANHMPVISRKTCSRLRKLGPEKSSSSGARRDCLSFASASTSTSGTRE